MSRSEELFQRAQKSIPGGVNSPVRAFNGVGGTPIFIERAQGAYMYDVDGNAYIDYVGSWGPMICGHANQEIVDAVKQAVDHGLSFGAPTELEVIMAEKICAIMPGMDQVRMTNSGTEATMSAIRLARGYTGRDKIVKFEGCYHGHGDSLLVKAGSGALTMGVPSSPGIPKALAENTITLEYNNIEQVNQLFDDIGDQIACLIVEPITGNMNCILPVPGFLESLRENCSKHGAVFIIDEVMTGFRVGLTGAQGYLGIEPDLTALGKVIGGGMASDNGVAMTANRAGGMFGLFFTDKPEVQSFADVSACDLERFKRFFHGMLERGVYLAPSAYEAGFVSSAHDDAILQQTIDSASEVFKAL